MIKLSTLRIAGSPTTAANAPATVVLISAVVMDVRWKNAQLRITRRIGLWEWVFRKFPQRTLGAVCLR